MNSGKLWKSLRDASPLAARPELVVWRLSVAPSAAPGVLAHIRAGGAALAWYDWAGGLIWLGLAPGEGDGGAARLRAALPAQGGHATLMRAPVCGLRTQRASRTRFSNEPKPVMATFSPLATSRVMVSSTDSSACAAAFLLPSYRAARASIN